MIEIHLRHGQSHPQTGALTDEGRRQAEIAGAYVRREFPRAFEIAVHSPSTRTRHTAELLGLPSTWAAEPHLIEKAGAAESWPETIARIGAVCDELAQTRPTTNRILVYHGEAMQAARAHREHLTGDRFARLSEIPYKYFTNCQLIIYTDEDPTTGAVTPNQLWVKSICPWAEGQFGHDWLLVSNS